MCGILAILGKSTLKITRERAIELGAKLRHRGPDWTGVHQTEKEIFVHERLAIVDTENGAQPLFDDDKSTVLIVNGEIYNHNELEKDLKGKYNFKTKSDCECIIYLYKEKGVNFVKELSGDFAFVISDGNSYMAARDPIGVCPLYIGYDRDGNVWFSSEMKTMIEECEKIETFPPGHYYTSTTGFERYYTPEYLTKTIPTKKCDLELLRKSLEESVNKRLMSDVPFGALLSGGLDSSLIAAIASRQIKNMSDNIYSTGKLVTFCIGVSKDSPDMIKAREVAKFLGTKHIEYTFKVQEGLDAIQTVIKHLETYDVTTIRASTPMFLLSRCVKSTGIKMVLSGEGSDEIFGGYLYFHHAPSPEEFHLETVRRVTNLHYADCLRANKSCMAWGVEIRVPFLDKEFLDIAMTIDPSEKLCNKEKKSTTGSPRPEKYILRKAFETKGKEDPYLPDNILWRQKEQFSDGVGYSWIDTLKIWTQDQVSDSEFEKRHQYYPYNTPSTKEAFYYRKIFEKIFPNKWAASTVQIWQPTWSDSNDPSGRAQKVHEAAY